MTKFVAVFEELAFLTKMLRTQLETTLCECLQQNWTKVHPTPNPASRLSYSLTRLRRRLLSPTKDVLVIWIPCIDVQECQDRASLEIICHYHPDVIVTRSDCTAFHGNCWGYRPRAGLASACSF